ncbi:MAG: alpha/beta hydrolase [Alphaproteobacteria bacterium]|nr:alpha/beta hydrolase [Alphaproteobacteria bacterium]
MPDVIINGPAGRIEGRYHHSPTPGASIALLLHPQPQAGGTMNNKVVYTAYQAFRARNFSVLRFNFRGVGRSQGTFDRGEGELFDAASALDWLQAYNPSARTCWIGGFSFGSWISLQLLMRRPEIDGFIAIAPPVARYDFSFLTPCPTSGMIVNGNDDPISPMSGIEPLMTRLAKQKDISVDHVVIKGADHFFRDKLDALTRAVDTYVGKRLKQLG